MIILVPILFSLAAPFAYGDGDEGLSLDDEIPTAAPVRRAQPSVWSVGVLTGYGMAMQGAKSFSTTDNLNWQTSSATGTAFEGGLFASRKWSKSSAFRAYVTYQNYRFTGTVTEVGIPTPPKNEVLTESMIAGGFDVLYYIWAKHRLWVGFGLEYARGISLQITFDGDIVPTGQENLANFVKASGIAGWDIPLSADVYMTPFLRVGDVLTQKPMILMFQAQLAVGYRL
jgi:hypothetical protein